MNNKITLSFFLFACIGLSHAQEVDKVVQTIKAGDLFATVKTLSAPEMKGRLAGSAGYEKAARWAASRFEEWGLKTVYGNSYLQPFKLDFNEMHDTRFSLMQSSAAGQERHEYKIYKDFCPTLYSGFGDIEEEVVFAGFGITAPDLDWDDYANIDVKGKIVAIQRGSPELKNKDFTKHAERTNKLQNAHLHEAAGVILIFAPVVSGSGEYMKDLPMVMVGDVVAEALVKDKGSSYAEIKKQLTAGKPIAFNTGVTARINSRGVHYDDSLTYNVVAMIEGSDPILKKEYMIFGGHLDAIGPWPVIHPGANDNASGSAVVMSIARAYTRLKQQPKRSVVFALFSGEELGLRGSSFMAKHLPSYPSKPLIMSNHDVNGTGRGLKIGGGEAYPEFYEHIMQAKRSTNVQIPVRPNKIGIVGGNSDYVSFLKEDIPSYAVEVEDSYNFGIHSAGDSIYIINPQIMEDISRLFFTASYSYLNK